MHTQEFTDVYRDLDINGSIFFFKARTNISCLQQQRQKNPQMPVFLKNFFFKTYMDAVTFINTLFVAVMNPAAFLCDSFETANPTDASFEYFFF